ncbi:tetratricopeptide repeat protein [Flavobacterium adhaerens]|uniref:tetratricopeptide repeat protein n=1 Tax=Flavobacterium adhaerens TaxID=3149043 RepID=UPI0032B3E975
MLELKLQSKIENELKGILHDAIVSENIKPDSLRMVILSFDSSFERLNVYALNEWKNYFLEKEHSIIGTINIAQWLDVADYVFENKYLIDSSCDELSKTFEKKYLETPPVITFKHLTTVDELYTSFLVCLREELLIQIENAIANVATTFSQEHFRHVVGFFTHNMRYNLEDKIFLQAFNNPNGSGTFYKVELTLPDYKFSNHYLHFIENGFQLYCPEGTYFEKSTTETEVYSYDVNDIAFIYERDNEIHLRLQDEFQDWKLEPRGGNIAIGEKSVKEFLIAFKEFFEKFPEKVFDLKNIPNPQIDQEAFARWVSIVLEYNIAIRNKEFEQIFAFGEEYYTSFFQSLPITAVQYEPALRFLVSKLFYVKRFQESVTLFDTIKRPANFNKLEYLCALFLLHQKEHYDRVSSTIEFDSKKEILRVLDILWQLRTPLDAEVLEGFKKELKELLHVSKKNETLPLISVALTKIYTLQNNTSKAFLHLQWVPTHETAERILLEIELAQYDYILNAFKKQAQKEQERVAFDKQIKNNSLNTEEKKKIVREKKSYPDSYYVQNKIAINDYKWVYPLDAKNFIAVQKGDGYELVLAQIKNGTSVEILQAITLSDTQREASCAYYNGVVYIVDTKAGVVTYRVSEETIERNSLVYKNEKAKSNYQNLTIADGYLYVSNNSYLEIYDLNVLDNNLISDSLYVNSGYYLFVRDNLLVVGAGAGLVILADISDKTNPVCLSTLQEDSTPGNMHVAFIDNYMLSRSLYDISDPTTPVWISAVQEDLAPTYYFAPKPEVPIISTGEEFLLTTILFENNQAVYTNWFESLNKDNWCYERALKNLATAYFDDTLITYSYYDIVLWEKGKSPIPEKIDVHEEIEKMVHDCFYYIVKEHPTFCIGKVVLEQDKMYQHINISFHQCSSLAILNDNNVLHELPIISSTFILDDYCREVFGHHYSPVKTQFVYDANSIIEQLQHRKFEQMASRHLLIKIDEKVTYIQKPTSPWNPFRLEFVSDENPENEDQQITVESVLLGQDENLKQQLVQKIDQNISSLNELLTILNMPIYFPKCDEDIAEEFESEMENLDVEEECNALPDYIIGPHCWPRISKEKEYEDEEDEYEDEYEYDEEFDVPSGYLPNTNKSFELKAKALELLSTLTDKELLKTILLNGMKYGYLHYSLKDIPDYRFINQDLTAKVVHNTYGLWDSVGKDSEITSFLMTHLVYFDDDNLQLNIVYKCGHLSHPFVSNFIQNTINEGINYYTYKGYNSGINFYLLPIEVLKPFEALLLEKSNYLENSDDFMVQLEAEEQLVYYYELLTKMGHEKMPTLVEKKLNKAVKEHEQYGTMTSDDDGYDSETDFLVNLYRNTKVKRLLEYYSVDSTSLWPLEEPLEQFDESWQKTIDTLLEKGTETFGNDFSKNYIKKLTSHITVDESYANDRVLASHLIQFVFKNIQQKTEMATLIEPLVQVVLENKNLFSDQIDIKTLLNESKYTLLQAAWNDIKNQDLDVAEQKANTILAIDAGMSQVYFLKARLLWLRKGISAYLEQQQSFVEKVYHDATAVAQLYNLTGCALDAEKRYEEALSYFKKAAQSAPSNAMYVANMAELYYKLGKPEEAVKYAKTALANGNQGDILKEIIENKGLLLHS